MDTLVILDRYLRTYHPNYDRATVVRSTTPGYLHCTIPCPRAGKHWRCAHPHHYHTISLRGVGYPRRDERGRWQSPIRLWEELAGLLPAEDPGAPYNTWGRLLTA